MAVALEDGEMGGSCDGAEGWGEGEHQGSVDGLAGEVATNSRPKELVEDGVEGLDLLGNGKMFEAAGLACAEPDSGAEDLESVLDERALE